MKRILYRKKSTPKYTLYKRDMQTSAFRPNQHLSNKGIKETNKFWVKEVISRLLICHLAIVISKYIWSIEIFIGFEWSFEDGSSKHFQFCILLFGLLSACYVFTKVLRPFIKRWKGIGTEDFVKKTNDEAFTRIKSSTIPEFKNKENKIRSETINSIMEKMTK